MQLLDEHYMELTPPDWYYAETKDEVLAYFHAGYEFRGDASLGFRLVTIEDFKLGTKVVLWFDYKRKVTTTEVW